MIVSREHLIHVLTEAAEIEHNLLCSYLYALFSLKRAGEGGLSPAQGETVESWRKTILSVALEEMAHLACVNNLLLAVGGAPHLNRPNLPAAPGYHPAGVVVRLTPFSRETLDHFIFLERPPTHARRDGEGFEDDTGAAREGRLATVTPSAIDYRTIGELYDAVAEAFTALAGQLGEASLIDASGTGQVSAKTAGLDDVCAVTNLQEALAVLERIKEQGEGASGARDDSHYQRFLDIKDQWTRLTDTDPTFEPAWPAASDPVMRRPTQDTERVWITEPNAAAHLDLANGAYGAMLSALCQVFGEPEPARQAVSMGVAIQMMEIVAGLGSALARLPATPTSEVHAGMTFAMPRNLGWRPTRQTTHLGEIVTRLRDRAAEVVSEPARSRILAKLDGLAA